MLRVIIDDARDPRMNMAIDEAIARRRVFKSYDTLRVYMWLPSGVTIGRKQILHEAINLEEISRRGYVFVRRPTGGAALLHPAYKEITYSVVLSKDHPLYTLDVSSSASEIAWGVAKAINRLGIYAGVRGSGGSIDASFCYLNPGSSDVMINGRKISGSAQRRSWGSLLQHGTILLDYDPDDFLSVIRIDENERITAKEKIAGLKDFIDRFDLGDLITYLIDSMSGVLRHREYFIGGLDIDEFKLSLELFEKKYSSDKWNFYGEDPFAD